MKKKSASLPRLDIPAARIPKKKTIGDPFARISLHPLEELEARDLETKNPEFSVDSASQDEVVDHTSQERSTDFEIVEVQNTESRSTTLKEMADRPPQQRFTTHDDGVDHTRKNWSTTKSGVVNNSTTLASVADNPTTEAPSGGLPDELFTTNKNVVVHTKRDWTTTERNRSRHNNKVESYRTSDEMQKRIKVFCAEMGWDKQDFYRLVVDHYFTCVVDPQRASVVGKSTLNDLQIKIAHKTRSSIINLYQAYQTAIEQPAKWKPFDDDAALKFNEIDIRYIELGILRTQDNKQYKGRINSFSYYAPEIQNFIDMKLNPGHLDVMIDVSRRGWSRATGITLDLSFLEERKK